MTETVMFNLWQFIGGDVPGGATLLLLSIGVGWGILEYVYRVGQTMPAPTYRRWRIRIPILLVVVYTLFWIQSPPKVQPLSIAVLCDSSRTAYPWKGEAVADLTVRRLQSTLKSALINPWRGATNYLQPTAESLDRAGYRVFIIQNSQTPTGYQVISFSHHALVCQLSAASLVEQSHAAAQEILAYLGKKPTVENPFPSLVQPAVLESYYQAQSFLISSDVDSAASLLAVCVQQDSNFILGRILLARCWEREERRTEAATLLLETAKLDPNSNEALLALGEFFLRTYEWEGAEAALKVVLSRDPLAVRAMVGLAQIHPERLKDLRLNTPLKLLKEAVRLDPAYEFARFMVADQLMDNLYLDRAQAVLREGLRINPEAQNLQLKAGVIELYSGDPVRSREIFEEMVRKNPQDAIAHFNLGVLHYRAQRFDQALAAFQQVERRQGPVDALYYLGLIYQQKGDQKQALHYFQERWEKRTGDQDVFGIKARKYTTELVPGGGSQ